MNAPHLFVLALSFLSTLSAASLQDSFQQTFVRYNQTPTVSMDLLKVLKSDLLATSKEQKGKLYFSKEKFRLSIFEPKREMVVYNGKTLWTEQIHEFNKGKKSIQVGKLQIDKKNQSQVLLSILFDINLFSKNFDRVYHAKKADSLIYKFKPKSKNLNLVNLEIEIDLLAKEIRRITYWDEINNETTLSFSNVLFSSKKQPELFQYTPPKDAEISQL